MTRQQAEAFVSNMLAPQEVPLEQAYREEISYRLAQEVRLRIHESGNSLRQFAEAKGLDAPQLSRQLSGTHNFTFKSAARLCAAIGVPLLSVCERPSYAFATQGLNQHAISKVKKAYARVGEGSGSLVDALGTAKPVKEVLSQAVANWEEHMRRFTHINTEATKSPKAAVRRVARTPYEAGTLSRGVEWDDNPPITSAMAA